MNSEAQSPQSFEMRSFPPVTMRGLWRSAHPSWVNWFRVPHWFYWLSYRPRRCCCCRRVYLGCWYTEFCSQKCSDTLNRALDEVMNRRLAELFKESP